MLFFHELRTVGYHECRIQMKYVMRPFHINLIRSFCHGSYSWATRKSSNWCYWFVSLSSMAHFRHATRRVNQRCETLCESIFAVKNRRYQKLIVLSSYYNQKLIFKTQSEIENMWQQFWLIWNGITVYQNQVDQKRTANNKWHALALYLWYAQFTFTVPNQWKRYLRWNDNSQICVKCYWALSKGVQQLQSDAFAVIFTVCYRNWLKKKWERENVCWKYSSKVITLTLTRFHFKSQSIWHCFSCCKMSVDESAS